MENKKIAEIVEKVPALKDKLYARGFLFTNAPVHCEAYPFYGQWQSETLGSFTLLVAQKQTYYVHIQAAVTMILVGHAYDPLDMLSDENVILSELCAAFCEDRDRFFQALNQLTGVFTLFALTKQCVFVIGDATCMQTTFYALKDGKIYVSSHTGLLGDLLNLPWDPYVKRLTQYPFFKLLGNSLPGDLTQFQEVKRLVPNHLVVFQDQSVQVKRFFWPQKCHLSNAQIEKEAAALLHNNLELISKKWSRPAISMTGGCDSKTTLACANGLYDRFSYFSYVSSESENVDAVAAHTICEHLGLKHTIYQIPASDDRFSCINEAQAILDCNTGNIIPTLRNEVRKRCFFADTDDFDIEVKSWASEIGRAYYSKRFNGRVNFGKKPSARVCTTLYKFFLHDRKLVRETDRIFQNYLQGFFEQAATDPIEWQEQFFWEFRVASWNGLVITGEHRYAFDVTIPYNNRKILCLLLSAPIQDRLHDTIYAGIRSLMNPSIDKTGVFVTNLKHTKLREKFENLYFTLHSKVPF